MHGFSRDTAGYRSSGLGLRKPLGDRKVRRERTQPELLPNNPDCYTCSSRTPGSGRGGHKDVTMRRKGGRAVGQARAAAVAQLFLSKDSRLRQPHQRQHPLPSQAPLDPPFLSFTCDCSPLPLHPSRFKSAIQLKRSWPGGKQRLVNAQHPPGTPKGIGCF